MAAVKNYIGPFLRKKEASVELDTTSVVTLSSGYEDMMQSSGDKGMETERGGMT